METLTAEMMRDRFLTADRVFRAVYGIVKSVRPYWHCNKHRHPSSEWLNKQSQSRLVFFFLTCALVMLGSKSDVARRVVNQFPGIYICTVQAESQRCWGVEGAAGLNQFHSSINCTAPIMLLRRTESWQLVLRLFSSMQRTMFEHKVGSYQIQNGGSCLARDKHFSEALWTRLDKALQKGSCFFNAVSSEVETLMLNLGLIFEALEEKIWCLYLPARYTCNTSQGRCITQSTDLGTEIRSCLPESEDTWGKVGSGVKHL